MKPARETRNRARKDEIAVIFMQYLLVEYQNQEDRKRLFSSVALLLALKNSTSALDTPLHGILRSHAILTLAYLLRESYTPLPN